MKVGAIVDVKDQSKAVAGGDVFISYASDMVAQQDPHCVVP